MDMKEDLNKIVYKYILNSGHGKCAAIFLKRSKLTNDDDDTPLSKEVLTSIADLTQIYETYRNSSKPTFIESTKPNNSKRNNLPTTVATAAAGVKTTEKPILTKKAAAKDSSSSSEDSSSSDDSSSDEEIAHTKTPVKSTSVTKPTPQSSAGKTSSVAVVAKASIAKISSSSSETESSDSDGSNDEEVVTKPTLKSTPVIKKNVEVKVVEKTKSSKTDLKPLSTTVSGSSKKPVQTKPSSSSDSDDDSSDDSSVGKTVATKPDSKSKATVELPIGKAKVVSKSAPGPSIAVKASVKPSTSVEKKTVIGKKSTAVQSNSSSDDSGSSDSDDSSSSSDESVPTKTPIACSLKSTPAKKLAAVESSEEDSENDSSSDESADVAAVVNDKKRKLNNVAVAAAQRPNNAKTKIQKVDSSSSESDSESSSDSDDSSDDSSDESESEEAIQERVQMKNELNKKKMEDSKRASEEWMKVTHHIYPYNVSVCNSQFILIMIYI